MSKKSINVKLLREIKKMILEEPRRLNMAHFAEMFADSAQPTEGNDYEPKKEERPPCGAVMCIAGHALLAEERSRGFFRKRFTRPVVDRIRTAAEGEAQDLLGLTDEQAERLFYFTDWNWLGDEGWPEEFADAYIKAKTPAQRARVTARRIEHFIKTNGAE